MDINTARQQIATAKSQIQQQREASQKAQQQLSQAQSKLPNVTSQRALRTGSYSGLNGRTKRLQVEKAGQEIKSRLGDIEKYRRDLSQYEKDVLKAEEDVSKVEQAQVRQAQLQTAYEVYTNQKTAGTLKGIPQDILTQARQLADKAEESKATQIAVQVKQLETKFPEYNIAFNPDIMKFEGLPKIDTSKMDRQSKTEIQEFNNLVDTSSKETKSLFGGELFPLVSASSKDLKSNININDNGLSISTGNVIGNIVDTSSKVGTRDTFTNSIINRAKEVFKGQSITGAITGASITNITTPSGVFVSAYPTGAGGTSFRYDLSPEQEKQMDVITNPIAKTIFGEYKSQNVLTANLRELSSQSKEYQKTINKIDDLNKQISNLEKGNININTNEWIGSDSDYKKYQETFNKYNREVERLKGVGARVTDTQIYSPTIKSGLFGMTRDIQRSNFDFSSYPIRSSKKAILSTLGSTAGVGTEKGLTKLGFEYTIPERKTTIYEPQFGTIELDAFGSPKTGYKDITIPSSKITPEKVGKVVSGVVETGGDIGSYFLPVVGTPLFFAETVEQMSPYGFNPVKFAKAEPLQATILGGIGAVTIIPKASRGLWKISEDINVRALESPYLFSSSNPLLLLKKQKNRFSSLSLDLGTAEGRAVLEEGEKVAKKYEEVIGKINKASNKEELKKAVEEMKNIKSNLLDYQLQEFQSLSLKKASEISGQSFIVSDGKIFSFETKTKPTITGGFTFETQIKPKVKEINWIGDFQQEKISQKKIEAQKQEPVSQYSLQQGNIQLLKFGQVSKQKESQLSRSALALKSSQASKQIELLKQEPKQKTSQLSKSALKSMLGLKTAQAQKSESISKQKPRQREPTKPKEPKVTKGFKLLLPTGSRETAKRETGLFTAFAKVFGKEKVVGRGTKKQAEEILGKFLKKELSASGGLETGGKRLKASEINLGEDFAKSKVSSFLVVEKKSKRLRKGTTGKEIQMFKKKSKKKSLLGI